MAPPDVLMVSSEQGYMLLFFLGLVLTVSRWERVNTPPALWAVVLQAPTRRSE